MNQHYEVLIIGGGPAGLSAAMTLGRFSRSALICDEGQPRNAPSKHVNNFPSQDGISPREWLSRTRKDLEKYKTVASYSGGVTSVEKNEAGFIAKLSTGSTVTSQKLILAYGVKDIPLPVPGFAELWGKSIFHCPFCHGYEIRGSKLGFIINGDMGFHALPLIYDLASDLIIFTNGSFQLNQDQRDVLARKKIELIESPLQKFLYEGESVRGVTTNDGQTIDREAFFYAPPLPMTLKSSIGQSLGCKINQFGLHETNEMGATNIPGVFACGDVSRFATVLLAAASGVTAGGGVVFELLNEKLNS